jgi:hypothetical protein
MCRMSGLERKRRCGWLGNIGPDASQVIWARGQVAIESCPTSYITAESLALLEEFHAWKLIGAGDVHQLSARVVEAIFILENEVRSEKQNASR